MDPRNDDRPLRDPEFSVATSLALMKLILCLDWETKQRLKDHLLGIVVADQEYASPLVEKEEVARALALYIDACE